MNTELSVSLFIPCLVDQVYPEIGIAMAKVLKHLGCQISYNNQQTCCGQPAFNAGHRDEARKVATAFINTFNQAYVEYGAVTWPNEIDLAPDAMYDEIKSNGTWILK